MKLRTVIPFLAAVTVFAFLSQATVRAFWIQKNGRLMWVAGQVLGTADDNTYTYIIHAIPTSVPTATPLPPTNSPTPTRSAQAVPDFIILNVSSSSSSTSSAQQSCFPAGTKILMADKTEKNIEDVKAGQYVLSDDHGTLTKAPVTKVKAPMSDHLYRIRLADGSTLRLTRDHPVFTGGGWKAISPEAALIVSKDIRTLPLSVDDSVYTAKGTYLKITDITYIPGNVQTYNLEEVEKTHTYFADGILVHNKLNTQGGPGLNGPNNNNGNQGGGTSSSTSSSSSAPRSSSSSSSRPAVVYCGGYICSSSQTCYQSRCWQKCATNGDCLGQYYCSQSACLPLSGGSGSSYSRAPTITPTPPQGGNPPPSSSSSPSSSPAVYNTPIIPRRPTNTPYPTRTPNGNLTSFSSERNGSAPVIIPPTPTAIPDFLRGKNSTIVIETGTSTTILKGEDVHAITIAAPAHAAERQQTSSSSRAPNDQNTAGSAAPKKPTPLNLSLEQKTGSKFAINQEELVVQKGKQRVTISVGDNNKGTLVLTQNDIKAVVTMGLSINPSTNILTVDTPNGPMRVSIMPDDAVAIAKQLKIADANKLPGEVTLLSRNSQLEYKISATKMEKLLWLIPVVIPQDVYLSADTGGIVDIKRSGLYNFVTLFTF